jgi:hypothetical protein
MVLNFNDHSVSWDTDTIPMKRLFRVSLVDVHLASSEPQSLVNEFSSSTTFLDAENKPAILDKVTQMCGNINSEEQHHTLKLVEKYEHLVHGTF